MDNIPKILHLYWDRGPMSWLQTLTTDTFVKYNPDWIINVYIPKQPPGINFKYIPDYCGKDFFSNVENNSAVNIVEVDLNHYDIRLDLHNILRSDILRYHLLYEHGGVWSDFDVLWLRPMMHLSTVAGRSDFLATICLFKKSHHNISILVSAPRHPFYKFIIDNCNLTQNFLKGVPDHQEYGTRMWNRIFPDLTGNDILTKYPSIVNLEYSTFFPYSIFEMGRLYNLTDLSVITDNVMCVHWFNGHVLSKKYVNNEEYAKPCSMTELIKLTGYGQND
jgi:hypothetical protein